MISFISDAVAANAATGPGDSMITSTLLMVGFILVFYFVLWRPQNKRQKDHRDLLSKLAKGDEVVTSGGIIGKITRINDNFVVLSIAENVEITVQRSAIAAALPKGTLKSIN